MRKVDRLLMMARETARSYDRRAIDAVFARMTTDQLRELAENDPTEERLREILASVDGLWLLESG
ncbi:MAG: hypothetical protein ACI4ML_02945 [Aristaeellaceae bacterium]